jgi:hypothetical protein
MAPSSSQDALGLVAFLLVSARNLIDEPPRYGPLRLVEASRRLIGTLERWGQSTEFLAHVASSAADMPALLMHGDEAFIEALDRLIEEISSQLAPRTDGDPSPR